MNKNCVPKPCHCQCQEEPLRLFCHLLWPCVKLQSRPPSVCTRSLSVCFFFEERSTLPSRTYWPIFPDQTTHRPFASSSPHIIPTTRTLLHSASWSIYFKSTILSIFFLFNFTWPACPLEIQKHLNDGSLSIVLFSVLWRTLFLPLCLKQPTQCHFR